MALDILTNAIRQERNKWNANREGREKSHYPHLQMTLSNTQKTLKIKAQDFRPDKYTKVTEDKIQHTQFSEFS